MRSPGLLVATLVAALGACSSGKSAPPPPPPTVAATDVLPITEEARAELPELAYQPRHSDAEYTEAGSPLPVIDYYLAPLDEEVIARRTAALPDDFKRVLGRDVRPQEAARWRDEVVKDVKRRRLVARALMDLYMDKALTQEDISRRLQNLHEGLAMAFQRITGITQDEHDKLSGG